jgi:hypothetical protein
MADAHIKPQEDKPMEGQNQIAAADQKTSVMSMIERVASDPQFDVAKLEKLIALQTQILDRQAAQDAEFRAQEAKRLYDTDFVQMKPELPLVIKTHDNTQTDSRYAKIEDVNQQVDPILAKYGFGTSSKVTAQTDKDVTMLLEVRHRGGHAETMTLTMPLDDCGAKGAVNKTKLHAISSTITYIKRVGFCAMLNISTGDDKDGNTNKKKGSPITVEEAADIDSRARALGDKYHAKFMEWLQVEIATEIPAKRYKEAIDALVASEKKAKCMICLS